MELFNLKNSASVIWHHRMSLPLTLAKTTTFLVSSRSVFRAMSFFYISFFFFFCYVASRYWNNK